VADAIAGLRDAVSVRLLSADTFGTARAIAHELGAQLEHIGVGHEKRACAQRLGAERCAAIGNGRNDVAMLSTVALGIAVIGPEGAAMQAIASADVVCTSVLDALALLREPARITATLRP
jgi:soluble P-type ATPase